MGEVSEIGLKLPEAVLSKSPDLNEEGMTEKTLSYVQGPVRWYNLSKERQGNLIPLCIQ